MKRCSETFQVYFWNKVSFSGFFSISDWKKCRRYGFRARKGNIRGMLFYNNAGIAQHTLVSIRDMWASLNDFPVHTYSEFVWKCFGAYAMRFCLCSLWSWKKNLLLFVVYRIEKGLLLCDWIVPPALSFSRYVYIFHNKGEGGCIIKLIFTQTIRAPYYINNMNRIAYGNFMSL